MASLQFKWLFVWDVLQRNMQYKQETAINVVQEIKTQTSENALIMSILSTFPVWNLNLAVLLVLLTFRVQFQRTLACTWDVNYIRSHHWHNAFRCSTFNALTQPLYWGSRCRSTGPSAHLTQWHHKILCARDRENSQDWLQIARVQVVAIPYPRKARFLMYVK